MFHSDTQYKMTTLNIKDLKPGMILASPVYNLQGVMILGKGIDITNKHLSMLKSWGTLEVDVENLERNEVDALFKGIDEETMMAIERELEMRFADVNESEVMSEIKRIAKKQMIEKILI